MSYSDFFNQTNNQSVEAEDPTALDQCMDLAFKWCDALGIPREAIRHQYAFQVWNNPTDITRQYFDLIPNGPNNKPQQGDLVIFKQTAGIPVGHISIETGQSTNLNAVTFDQNWDTIHYYHLDSKGNHIPYCRTVLHSNYYGVIGWLHPKQILQPVNQNDLLKAVKDVVYSSASPQEKIDKLLKLLA